MTTSRLVGLGAERPSSDAPGHARNPTGLPHSKGDRGFALRLPVLRWTLIARNPCTARPRPITGSPGIANHRLPKRFRDGLEAASIGPRIRPDRSHSTDIPGSDGPARPSKSADVGRCSAPAESAATRIRHRSSTHIGGIAIPARAAPHVDNAPTFRGGPH